MPHAGPYFTGKGVHRYCIHLRGSTPIHVYWYTAYVWVKLLCPNMISICVHIPECTQGKFGGPSCT